MTDAEETNDEEVLEEMAEDVMDHVKEPRKAWTTRVIVIVVLVAMAVAFVLWRQSKAGQPTFEYITAAVDRGDIITVATATGSLEPERTVTVGAEISGLIASVEVDDNDKVTKGQVLARFDTDSLKTSLAQARAGVRTANANVRRAQANLKEAKREVARIEPLVKKKVVATSQLDSATTAVARAEADLASTRAEVDRQKRTVELTRTNLDKGEIVSPIDGVVLKRSVEPGNAVAASLQAPELFILAQDLTKMELHVAVDEADIGQIKNGLSATFTVDAWPDRTFEATVIEVSLYPTRTGNVVTYDTVLGVDNSDGALRPGMTATADIITGRADDVLRVPNTALRWTPTRESAGGGIFSGPRGRNPQVSKTHKTNTVWVVEEGEPLEHEFEPGRTDGRLTEAKSDTLEPGTQVITGTRPLKAGGAE